MEYEGCGDYSCCPPDAGVLADWERELLDPTWALPDSLEEGEGHISFITHDNREVTLRNMRYDTASPVDEDGNYGRNVVAVERFDDGRIFHVPNVAFWSVDFD
jgi:hypothetical protein